jgi:GNAT superfamily N-acetyltransferase
MTAPEPANTAPANFAPMAAETQRPAAAASSSMAPVMRRARREDVPAIIDLLVAGEIAGAFGPGPAATTTPDYLAAFEAIDADPRQRLFVAEWQVRVVGTLQITFGRTLAYGARQTATLESVHVAPDLRGHGIGARMIAEALDVARAAGAEVVQLTSNKLRTDAHRFYERLGFKRSHEGFKLQL